MTTLQGYFENGTFIADDAKLDVSTLTEHKHVTVTVQDDVQWRVENAAAWQKAIEALRLCKDELPDNFLDIARGRA